MVPGPDGKMTRVNTFEEAAALRHKDSIKPSKLREARDILATAILWHRHYFGIQPRTMYQNWFYGRKLKAAVEAKRGQTPRG